MKHGLLYYSYSGKMLSEPKYQQRGSYYMSTYGKYKYQVHQRGIKEENKTHTKKNAKTEV
jgi:hypothetical protein